MLISVKLRYTNGGKVCLLNFMLLYIWNNFDDLTPIAANFREVVGDLIDPPPYPHAQLIKRRKSPAIVGLTLILRVCI